MSERRGDWCQTFTGRMFWPCDPRADEVCVEDIAHALALQCRFAGHVREFYSVAEHSVRVSEVVPAEHALAALLHDAAEAYVVDVPRPLKPWLTGYRAIEAVCAIAVEKRFGLADAALDAEAVKHADAVLLATEARDLMVWPPPSDWHLDADPLPARIHPWPWRDAEAAFLARFAMLERARG